MIDGDPDIVGVECLTIDNFIDREQIGHVDILHADIQGAEYPMLLSCIKHLNAIDYFFISTHDYESHHIVL
jgi:hypothetical protein